MAGNSKTSKTVVWVILGLLVLGLGGFGVRNLSGTIRTVASVGDQEIDVDRYARELQREIRATEAQIGQPLPMDQAIAAGLDRVVMSRLVSLAALDNEVAAIGLSIGDANLQQEIVQIPAFQGANGGFDRDSYRFALEQAGLNEAEFEADLRAEAARTLVQGAVMAGVAMPDVAADTLVDYIAARRSFTWAPLDASALPEPIPTPTEEDLRAFYDANPERFRLPETKQLTYVELTPSMLLESIEVDDQAIQDLYDQRADVYQLPERRLVERLVFGDSEAAASARAQLDVGGTTFEKLVTDRGLALADVDLGDVTADDLEDAAEAVFAAGVGDVVGPVDSTLGPALYRVNGVLAARSTSLEDARAELRSELAADRARRRVTGLSQEIDDLLAGGATLEEVAAETAMTLGTIDWTAQTFDGIAAYDSFRKAASAVTTEDYPAIDFLDDGGIFALRLDQILPERPMPYADARDLVAAAWTRERTDAALLELAQAAVTKMAGGADFTEAGLTPRVENGLTRTAYIDGTAPDFMIQLFEMEPGEIRVISGPGIVHVVRLDRIAGPEENDDNTAMRAAISDQMNQALSQALFDAYVNDTRARARPQIDQRAVNAVHANFR